MNVRFQKVTDFEFTDELSVFDMLGINLVHGWLYDPQDLKTQEAVSDKSYNQLITTLVEADSEHKPDSPAETKPETPGEWTRLPSVATWYTMSRRPGSGDAGGKEQEEVDTGISEEQSLQLMKKLRAAHAVEEWLQESASQLTYYGLAQLHAVSASSLVLLTTAKNDCMLRACLSS